MTIPKNKNLNMKQTKFCYQYVKDYNATQAYIRAGYSKKGAGQSASALLKNPAVLLKIKELEQEANVTYEKELKERLMVSRENILQERARMAFVTIKDCYNADGTLIPPHEMEDHVAAAIASFKAQYYENGNVKNIDVRLHNKDSALTALERIEGMYEADNKQLNPYAGKTLEELQELRDQKLGKIIELYKEGAVRKQRGQ